MNTQNNLGFNRFNDMYLISKEYIIVPVTEAKETYHQAIALSLAFQNDPKPINPMLNKLADPRLRNRIRKGKLLNEDKDVVHILQPYLDKSNTINLNDIEKDGTLVKIYKFIGNRFVKDTSHIITRNHSNFCKYKAMIYLRSKNDTPHYDVILPCNLLQSTKKHLPFSKNPLLPIQRERTLQSETIQVNRPKEKLKEEKITNQKMKEVKSSRERNICKITKTPHSKNFSDSKAINIENATINIFQTSKVRKNSGTRRKSISEVKEDSQNKSDITPSNFIGDHAKRTLRSNLKFTTLNSRNIEETVANPILALLAEEPYLAELTEEPYMAEIDLNIPIILELPSNEYFR